MLKVLARPTRNAVQFYDKGKEANFSAHASQIFAGLNERFDFHGFNLSFFSFVSMP